MTPFKTLLRRAALTAAVLLASTTARAADPKIDAQPLAPAGQWVGFAIGPHAHAAALALKGSRMVVILDAGDPIKVDQLINFDGSPFLSPPGPDNATLIPVRFSDDGAHSAFFARSGDDYVLYQDGKEAVRGKYATTTLSYGPLTFTAGGKHLYYGTLGADGRYHVVVDGKEGPASHTVFQSITTSRDGEHVAYTGTQPDGHDTPWTVIDGRQVKFFGNELHYSANNHLYAVLHEGGATFLVLDGKPVVKALNIRILNTADTGGSIAAMITPNQQTPEMLAINGKLVPGTEGVSVKRVIFSPDGKHFAAICQKSASESFVILDGKKGQSYQNVDDNPPGLAMMNRSAEVRAWERGVAQDVQTREDQTVPAPIPGYTADSTKFLYVATMSGRFFLVTNEDESDGYQGSLFPVLGAGGKRVGFVTATLNNGSQVICIDGKTTPVAKPGVGALIFSPGDAAHTLYPVRGALVLDGVEQPGYTTDGHYMFSPDGKHVLARGASPTKTGLWLDGHLIAEGNTPRPQWTPDAKHLFWSGYRPAKASNDYDTTVLYVDGKPTPIEYRMNVQYDQAAGNFDVSPDGVLTFIARSGDDLKRYRVTPAPEDGVAAMLAAAPKP